MSVVLGALILVGVVLVLAVFVGWCTAGEGDGFAVGFFAILAIPAFFGAAAGLIWAVVIGLRLMGVAA